MSHSSFTTTSNHFLCHFLGNLEFWLPILTAYLVITVFTLEDVRCVYQISFTHISIPSSILPVWFQSVLCSMFCAYSIPAAPFPSHTKQQQRLWCSFQAVKSSLYGFAYFCAPRAQSPAKKICLLQAAPVKKCIQLQTFYGTSNGVCFMGYVVIVWYQISFEPGWLRLFQSGVALLHIKAIKYLHPLAYLLPHRERESGIHTWIFWPTAIKQGLPTDLWYPIYAWMGASCFVIIVMSEWRLPSFLRLERETGTSMPMSGLGWNQSRAKEISYMNCFTGINGKEGKSGRIFLLLKLWKRCDVTTFQSSPGIRKRCFGFETKNELHVPDKKH